MAIYNEHFSRPTAIAVCRDTLLVMRRGTKKIREREAVYNLWKIHIISILIFQLATANSLSGQSFNFGCAIYLKALQGYEQNRMDRYCPTNVP